VTRPYQAAVRLHHGTPSKGHGNAVECKHWHSGREAAKTIQIQYLLSRESEKRSDIPLRASSAPGLP